MKTANVSVSMLTKTALFLGITLAFQMLALPQYLTGPAINAMLLISTIILGYKSAMVIGALTPVIAFVRGILAPPLGPAIPFIVLGNWLYVILFNYLSKINNILAIAVASIAKFAALAIAVRLVIEVPPQVAQMLQFPQLITALVGGFIALILSPYLRKALDKIDTKARGQ
ncbi:hypothetical protein [Natranaerobius thermophilus]|uniref:HymD protein n=1 Tax=Natranaerobius thermophilus (strain ATCC BAA-1301 / DSM 18059 / JW/NM-WN-LF) TaxID=457570 RepID=B2A2P5_NATTJ|nr:hypothetical protein [Natranaerobius thermophilus]ACB86263.1 conserved hypothetical protein [Natranaerobius thermophilus JW/NM-WN-LF]